MEKETVNVREAAYLLSVSIGTIYAMIARELFEVVTCSGTRGRGSKMLIRIKELKRFAEGGELWVIECRKQEERSRPWGQFKKRTRRS